MKKILFAFVVLIAFAGTVEAQDAKKLLKQAGKTMGKYIGNAAENPGALAEIKSSIETAMADDAFAAKADNWIKVGEMYDKLSDSEVKMLFLNPGAGVSTPDAALTAYNAYKKAADIATKKGDKKKAIKGIQGSETHLNNYGIELYKAKDYDNAFKNFDTSIKAQKFLKEIGEQSRLDDPTAYGEQAFFTAISAYYNQDMVAAKPYFKEIYDAGSDEPLIYEGLYNMTKDDNKEEAIGYLTAGREKFPDDTGMLFAEINYYLNEGKLNILIEKLKIAQEKEPDNMSVVNTIGNVYDQLHQTAEKEGDTAKSAEYFDQAMSYYTQVIDKDPQNFDATYAQGALYYNKAASYTTKLNELSNDYSKAATAKYDALKKEMDDLFGMALPYFKKAEEIDGKDYNTILALREIYARQSAFDKVNEYKTKLEALEE